MKVGIFIDGGYFEKILKQFYHEPKIDWKKLSEELCRGSKEILRTYYYHCDPYQSNPPSPEERKRFSKRQGFFYYLSCLPRYEVRKGKLEFRGTDNQGNKKFEQKGVDTLLSIDMVSLAATGKISDAIILAGDSDFLPAVKTIKPFGVNIILWHGPTRSSYHVELWRACDERNVISKEFINKVIKQPYIPPLPS